MRALGHHGGGQHEVQRQDHHGGGQHDMLDTLRYCEKFRDLGFRSILDMIFSNLNSGIVLECNGFLMSEK